MLDYFAVDIHYRKPCYVKCTMNPTEKSDKNDNNKEHKSKYLINEAPEIFINKEAFLHYNLEYVK